MELKKTVERIVPRNFKTREEYLLYLRHIFAYEQAVSHLKKKFELLEIGFGEGYGACLLADHVKSVDALDVHKKAVLYANKKYGREGCTFTHYDGKRLPYDDEKFDAVISFQVLEHIKDDHSFLKEIHRVLKKNGTVVLTTPNRETRLQPGEKPWNMFHIREYSSNQLRELLSRYFSKIDIMGVRADDEVETIESNRVERKLSLYKLLPDVLKRFFTNDFENEYDTDVFFLEEKNVTKSMDLFAVALK